jgi:hypothetical protein
VGSQTDGKPAPLRCLTIGLALFDHPEFSRLYGDTDAIALWLFLSVEACKTQGVITQGIVAKAGPVIGSKRRVMAAIARMVEAGPVLLADGVYSVAGWNKLQSDGHRKPSDLPEATRERKRKSRAGHVTPIVTPVTRDGHDRKEETPPSGAPPHPPASAGAGGREDHRPRTHTGTRSFKETVEGLGFDPSKIGHKRAVGPTP